MNKVQAPFSLGKPVLIAYVPAGDPEFSRVILDAYVNGGVDILEIGLPSADPYMDGHTMSSSMKRAKTAGTDGNKIAKVLREWLPTLARRPALVWMCYADADFTDLEVWAKDGLIDAVLMLGEQPVGFESRLVACGVAHCVFLPWEYSTQAELSAQSATGYIMVPTRPGKTGTSAVAGDPSSVVSRMRELNPRVPIVAGFGVDDAQSALRVLDSGADGVVIGTKCIEVLFESGVSGLQSLLSSISLSLSKYSLLNAKSISR